MRRPFVVIVAALAGCADPRAPVPATAHAPATTASSGSGDRKVAVDVDPDPDHDGVFDPDDLCPADVEDVDGFEDDDGCPDVDNDKDGILDATDKCPNEAETYNGKDDEDGCPDKAVIIVTSNPPMPIHFVFVPGTSKLVPESMPAVHAVAQTLTAHPEITLVEVEGFTDENGPVAKNVKLSLDRAKAVVAAVVADGVDPSRLRAVGFGPYCPVDAAHDEAAWSHNRRVEMKVITTASGPTGVVTGCAEATAHGLVSPTTP